MMLLSEPVSTVRVMVELERTASKLAIWGSVRDRGAVFCLKPLPINLPEQILICPHRLTFF